MKGYDKLEFKLPNRPQESNKGTFGRVLNIAGSEFMPGAGYLSSVAALKTGCGYCFLYTDPKVIPIVASKAHSVVFVLDKDLRGNFKTDVVSIGCGLTTKADKLFKTIVKKFNDKPMVIDADGLNILAQNNVKLSDNTILTPHPMEAARLLDTDVKQILDNKKEAAREISKKYNCITVLKSHNTVVCSKELEIYTNNTGNSALAKAGSGDVLTGMIAGFLAQGMDSFEAAKLGVYLHGLCGEIASEKLTEYSVMAEDLISFIPESIKTILAVEFCN